MIKFSFDVNKYKFKEMVSDLFEVDNLEKIHEHNPELVKDDYRKNKVATSVNDQGEDERFSHYGTGLVNPMPKGEINKLKEIDYGGKDLSEFQTTKNARPDFRDVEDETTFFIAPLLK